MAATTEIMSAFPQTKLTLPPPPGPLLTSDPSHASQVARLDRVSCLFGTPIAHSLSPLIHRAVYEKLGLNWKYFLHESDSIPSFLEFTKQPKFFGAAVTMPHKVAIIPYLDDLTPEGRAVGAINTVFLRYGEDGKRQLVGTNTDTIGVREGIKQNISAAKWESLVGKPGLIIGGGGTSRAAVYALKNSMKCNKVYFINRDKSEVDAVIQECTKAGFGDGLIYIATPEQAAGLEPAEVVVSAVPNFTPKTAEEKNARACAEVMLSKARGALLEMCYHPTGNTEIKRLAEMAGWQVVPGTEAMIWQGLEQNKYWTGQPISNMPVAELKEIIREALEHH